MSSFCLPQDVTVRILSDIFHKSVDDGKATSLWENKVLICVEFKKDLHRGVKGDRGKRSLGTHVFLVMMD